ncbi:MAG: sulfotransferase [Bacteroidota bacterium]
MQKLVFISGLHRSGTSILHRTLSASNQISGFSGTGVPEDEGQHLQSVYPPARAYGGAGRFAFAKEAKLDENSTLISLENRAKLLNEWKVHWDASKPIWIEKSPPNIIRTRFLQTLFPEAFFITIVRHPVAVSLATQKWSKTALPELIRHWIAAHNIYKEDRTHLKNELFFSYEYMVQHPQALITALEDFLGTTVPHDHNIRNTNNKYFEKWEVKKPWELKKKLVKSKCIKLFERSVNDLGYSLTDLKRYPNFGRS